MGVEGRSLCIELHDSPFSLFPSTPWSGYLQVEMETAVCEIKLEDVEATPPFSPDGGLIAAGSTNETTGEAEEEEGGRRGELVLYL